MVSLEQQFSDTNNRHLHYQQLKVVDEVLRDYKRDTGKLDFVDMIDRFIEQGEGPRLEVLIVDEAQDWLHYSGAWFRGVEATGKAYLFCRR